MTDDLTNDTAGAGSPAPAVSSPQPDTARPGADVVAPQARLELERIRRRWSELPLDRAEARMPPLRRLLADLAPRSGDGAVPDLGPAVVVDQLAVLVWDAYAAGRGDGIPELLTAARRELG
ncbi:MAG TPA: hypothetical protein VES93_01985 [Ornithinibacter sp.]|nr:hypothetical protein [Ornithinibacter sp.]